VNSNFATSKTTGIRGKITVVRFHLTHDCLMVCMEIDRRKEKTFHLRQKLGGCIWTKCWK